MPAATMTTKGQITIPKEVRQRLKLHAGDRVNFVVRPDGAVLLKPAKIDIRELGGLLHRKGRKPVTIEQMDAGVARLLGRRR
jgi:AbrB family looped-hinge helix DNA binding protein